MEAKFVNSLLNNHPPHIISHVRILSTFNLVTLSHHRNQRGTTHARSKYSAIYTFDSFRQANDANPLHQAPPTRQQLPSCPPDHPTLHLSAHPHHFVSKSQQ